MVMKALQLKRAQFAYRSEYRKFLKAFVLGARAKARFHTLPVSLPKSSSELSFGALRHSKLSSTLSALCNSYSGLRPILFLPFAIFPAKCGLRNAATP